MKPVHSPHPTSLISAMGMLLFVIGIAAFYLGRLTAGPPEEYRQNASDLPLPVARQYQPTPFPTTNPQGPIDGKCSSQGCLFADPSNDAVIGFGSLDGYYVQNPKKDMDGVDVLCDSLAITGGSAELIKHFTKWVLSGNTLNTINEDKELLVNVNFDGLSNQARELITASTRAAPVALDVVRILPVGSDAAACTSVLDIVDVN